MPRTYNSILECVGRTPVVRINRLAPDHVALYAKVESMNPMGSVKDRLALGIIEAAEADGNLHPGQTVIEATSGNTGIGLAMVCAQRGYPLVIVMAENFSVERRKLMRFLGANVVLTPAAAKGSGMIAKARELAEAHGWFLCRQFENEANADTHSETTAREIIDDFDGIGPDYFVTGLGTGGTLKGIARTLRAECPQTRIVACEPRNSAMLGSGIRQEFGADGAPSASHPSFRPHPMQGWSPDFIPKLADDALVGGLVDEIVPVSGSEALDYARRLARKEGIFCGITSGATLAAALAVAERAPAGSKILCMLPDTGERYQSTVLFDGIEADMSDEELAISTSTPSARFDLSAPAAPIAIPRIAADHKGRLAIDRILAETAEPLIMFGLEWCEFCWSARRLLGDCGIAFRAVDLDGPELSPELAAAVRQALLARTGAPTLPQIFSGSQLIGGCTDLFDAYTNGRLRGWLAKCGVDLPANEGVDVAGYLPRWMQVRA
jgi:cysteine synthase